MCGMKDEYAVHCPCRHCMVHKDEMGNVETNADEKMEIKRELRKKRYLKSAKESNIPSKPKFLLWFVLDKSRSIFENIPWKYPMQIYCMTFMCILRVFLSQGIAKYALQ